jgi:hypothetical protein
MRDSKADLGPQLDTIRAVPFALLALLLLATLWPMIRATSVTGVLKVAIAPILLGLASAMAYEAAAVWERSSSLPTISKLANGAFAAHRDLWGAAFLLVVLVGGLLTMHFTRAVQKPEAAEWDLVVSAVLFLLNGAVIAYWFNWLP